MNEVGIFWFYIISIKWLKCKIISSFTTFRCRFFMRLAEKRRSLIQASDLVWLMSRFRLSLIFTALEMKLNWFSWKRYNSDSLPRSKLTPQPTESMKSIFFSIERNQFLSFAFQFFSGENFVYSVTYFMWWWSNDWHFCFRFDWAILFSAVYSINVKYP